MKWRVEYTLPGPAGRIPVSSTAIPRPPRRAGEAGPPAPRRRVERVGLRAPADPLAHGPVAARVGDVLGSRRHQGGEGALFHALPGAGLVVGDSGGPPG